MKQKTNYRMIELARASRGVTQKELASLLNINQSNISKIEKGELSISGEILNLLSKALNYPLDFFCQDELRTPFLNIYFRKRTAIKQKSLDKIFSDIKIILKSIDYLLENIELKEYRKYSFEGWTPASVAVRIREIFRIPNGPVKNIIKTIEDEGIIVYFYDCTEDKFDGLTSYTDNGYPVIVVNQNMPNDRIRFTIAHELGHLVLHFPCDVEAWRDVENEANEFASEFLMPARDCYSELKNISFGKLGMIKAFWGVSKAFIIRRAKTIGTISEATYKYLMIELGRKNERKVETGYVDIDSPNIISDSLSIIKSELHYSDDDLANVVRLYPNDYYNYFEHDKKVVRLRPMKKVV
jgi:Zn-dependent peptidase ImmA (M78 family)/DNA-binding Xre family transcriptional regulator